MSGINDRFGDNAALFEVCFMDLIGEANVGLLRQAMLAKDYAAAFTAAHALKGISGNLGLTPYYQAICALVESLRANSYAQADEQFAQVEQQFNVLTALLSDDAPPEPQAAPVLQEAEAEKPVARLKKLHDRLRSSRYRFVLATAAVLLLLFLALFLLFRKLTSSYQFNVTSESASHLTEINHQLQRSVEERIESDWMLAHTVRSFLTVSANERDDDKQVLHLLEIIGSTWDVSDISLYTEDGQSINLSGSTEAKDMASERAANVQRTGECLTILNSSITYNVSLNTKLSFHGSPVVALSIVRDMRSFLDDMEFSSFNKAAYMYLTDSTGKVFSRLTTGESAQVFNIMPLFDEELVSAVTGRHTSPDTILTANTTTVLTTRGKYVVTTPVLTRHDDFRLVYIVPQSAVNATMDSYTNNITITSVFVLLAFAVCSLIMVTYQYRANKKQFDTALSLREHMFDLLVQNTRATFALFRLDQEQPVFISDTSEKNFAIKTPSLHKTEEGYCIRSHTDSDAAALRELNESLRTWDGKSVFRSGYLVNSDVVPPVYFEAKLFPIANSPDEYVGIVQDMTVLQEREEAIKTALLLSERGSQAKTQFLSNMSHDIRTPMNAIVNLADFAIDEMNDPEKLRDTLKAIRESSDHLLMLINDILEASRLEGGNTELIDRPFDLFQELEHISSIVKPLCAEKNQLLFADFSGLNTRLVAGDLPKVSQILMQLFSNAIKFTPAYGAVRFTATELPSLREEYAFIRFIVEDTGIGIPEDFLPHIYEPFTRADEKRVGGIEGTGLGLSICHSYVVAMGGHISCESEPNEGSVFTVDLYFKKTNALPERKEVFSAQEVTPFAGKRCLLCEDNPTNRRIALTMLERLGFTVDTAENGSEGLNCFRRSFPGFYSVIYMDIQMPVMDGYETAEAIRSCNHTDAKTVPIIALTANVFMEDIEKAHIAGMDGHVGKPISTGTLANETKRVITKKERRL